MIPLCIVELSNQRDREMMTTIYLEYRRYMFSIALRLLQSESDADDVIQSCWLSWCNAHDLAVIRSKQSNPKELRNYIAKCVRNKSYTLLRKKIRQQVVNLDDLLIQPLSKQTVEDEALLKVEIENCYDAILRLPTYLRTVMQLCYVDELTHKEIAALTGKPERTIRALLSEGRAKLKATMKRGDRIR